MSPDFLHRHPRLAELFGIDLRTLALFRVALGTVLFCNLLLAFCDLSAFWTDAGVMPRSWLLQFEPAQRISLYLAGGQAWFVGTLLAAQTDFEDAGELKLFIDEMTLHWLDQRMARKGYLDRIRGS